MPNIVRIRDFRSKHAPYIKKMLSGEMEYLYVANETYTNRSFVVTTPHKYAELLKKSGNESEANVILDIVQQVIFKVSEKYRQVQMKRMKPHV